MSLPGLTKFWCQFADFFFFLWHLLLFLLIMFQIKKANGAETHNMRGKKFTNIDDVSSFLILRQVNYSFLHSRLIRRRRIMRWPAWRIFWRSSHLVCQVNHHIRRSVSYICYSQGNLRVLAAVLSCLPLLLSSSAWHCCLCPCSSVSRWALSMPSKLTKCHHHLSGCEGIWASCNIPSWSTEVRRSQGTRNILHCALYWLL